MAESFANEFIEDYYAECAEHLSTIRRVLLVWEEQGDRAPYAEETAELNRSLHTVKGLSGMVGYGDTEKIAHLLEEWVRGAMKAGEPVASTALSGLFEGAKLLDASLEAHRNGAAAPSTESFEARVDALRKPSTSATSFGAQQPAKGSPLARAIEENARLVEFNFTPTKDLAARGVTVESVRARLSQIGAIVQALPRMLDGGGVAFDFVVAMTPGADPSEELAADGINIRVIETPVPVAAATPSHTEAAPAAARLSSSSVVRVELARLDDLMRLVGDLVITRGRVDDGISALEQRSAAAASLSDANALMERQLRDLREAIMRVRMVPIAEVFDRMRYGAREVARESGKQVRIETSGEHTEVDKLVVDRMLEPMLHLVRNAVGHGIETPAEREARGKNVVGVLEMRASTAGERIRIEIEDDGAGIDFTSVQRRAVSLGLIEPDTAVDAKNSLDLISAPGFSTRDDADLTSGRGVGMAVVRQRVRELGGTLTVASERGKGTRFEIQLPLTLMIVDAVMFRMDGHLMAAPQPGLLEVLQVEHSAIAPFENNEVVQYREGILPLFRLRSLFGMPPLKSDRETNHVLVIGSEANPIGIVVDRIVGQREIVVRSLRDPLVDVPGISGATELSDGTVALILDTTQLSERALQVRE
jgi:two-component system chemotaxis sensor kinase CheA